MVKMKVLPEPLVKMSVETEIIDISAEAYDKGYSKGYTEGKTEGVAEGIEQGIEQGKQAEHNAFWDNYLSATDFQYAFAGKCWTDETFKPTKKIPLSSGYARYMFFQSGVRKSPYLKELDFSQCTAVVQTFYSSAVEELGVLDFSRVQSGWGGLNQTFYGCSNLKSIEKIIMPNTAIPNGGFNGCTSLEEVRFEGKLFGNQNFQWCPLSVESMKSTISCLNNYAGTSEAYSYKVTFPNECWEALEADSKAPDGGTWRDYVDGLGWVT